MSIPFTSLVIEWYTGALWVDITSDVMVSPAPRGSRGILSTDINARVGSVGQLSFSLRNGSNNSAGLEGYYTPGHPNCIGANWGKPYNYPIKITCTYGGRNKVLWYGTFEPGPDGVKVVPGQYDERRVDCRFRDWMGLAMERKLNLLSIDTYKRVDQAVTLLLGQLAAAELPQTTYFRNGDSSFLSIFDDTNSGTTVYTELDKLAKSELGYIYVKADRTTGEQLTVENRNLRWQAGGLTSSGGAQDTNETLALEDGDDLELEDGDLLLIDMVWNSVSRVMKDDADLDYLILEDGDTFIFEDGDTMLLAETVEAVFDAGDILRDRGFEIRHRDNSYYSARVSVQQKKKGTSTVVLWEMNQPMLIKKGQTLRGIRGRYRDPTGGASYVNGYQFSALASGTDWTANTEDDGSGTDMTADIAVVTNGNPGSAEVEFRLYNNGAVDCYVTKLQIRGKAIYSYDSLDIVLGSDTGKKRFELNLHYETNAAVGTSFAEDITRIPDGTVTIQKMPLWANRDAFNINAFMDLDIGSLYAVSEQVSYPSQDNPFFINGYEFELMKTSAGFEVIWTPNGLPYSRVYKP